MCIRALDYCPPVDITFGEYLRALITADADLVPDDDRGYRVAMIGAGKIGSALVQYRGFRQRGFDVAAIFDVDPAKIGKAWNGLTVQEIAALEEVVKA